MICDGVTLVQDVWSQPVSRKNKKKSLVENDPLAVLADTTTSSSSSSKTTAPHGAGNPSRVTPRAGERAYIILLSVCFRLSVLVCCLSVCCLCLFVCLFICYFSVCLSIYLLFLCLFVFFCMSVFSF